MRAVDTRYRATPGNRSSESDTAVCERCVVWVYWYRIAGSRSSPKRRHSLSVLSPTPSPFPYSVHVFRRFHCPQPRSRAPKHARTADHSFRRSPTERGVTAPLNDTGALYFMAGVVGLWAVFGSNTTAAKCYLWTWAPRFLFAVGTIIYSTPGTLLSILLRVGYLLLLLRFSMVRRLASAWYAHTSRGCRAS